jgi:hypothetical protein
MHSLADGRLRVKVVSVYRACRGSHRPTPPAAIFLLTSPSRKRLALGGRCSMTSTGSSTWRFRRAATTTAAMLTRCLSKSNLRVFEAGRHPPSWHRGPQHNQSAPPSRRRSAAARNAVSFLVLRDGAARRDWGPVPSAAPVDQGGRLKRRSWIADITRSDPRMCP